MTDLQTLRDDLAFMKQLATDEGRPHWVIGANFLAAGLLYGVPLYLVWGILRGLVDLPQGWTSWVSVYSTAVFIPVEILLSLKARAFRGAAPPSRITRSFGALWGTVGLTTLVILFAIFWGGARLHVPEMWQVWCSICFALYGSCWIGVAIVSRNRGWALVGLGAYLNALVNALLIGHGPDILLGVATGLVLWLALPGAVLMRRASAAA